LLVLRCCCPVGRGGWWCCGCGVPRSRRAPGVPAVPGCGGAPVAARAVPHIPARSLVLGVRCGWPAGSAAGGARPLGRWAGCSPGCRPAFAGLAVRSLSLFPASAPAVVGFSGSRRLSLAFAPLVAGVVASALARGRSVAVGCAAGADSFVRAAAPGALVFSASAFGSGRGAFAARSVALVRAVAAGGPGSGFVVFPAAPCPAGLSPSARSSACFCGSGSGSWASAAFAAGLGLPLVVFPCGFPPSSLPPWGLWVPAGSGVWAVGFLLR
jgi:hypothetical protein